MYMALVILEMHKAVTEVSELRSFEVQIATTSYWSNPARTLPSI